MLRGLCNIPLKITIKNTYSYQKETGLHSTGCRDIGATEASELNIERGVNIYAIIVIYTRSLVQLLKLQDVTLFVNCGMLEDCYNCAQGAKSADIMHSMNTILTAQSPLLTL